jgi:WD40 repeat protein
VFATGGRDGSVRLWDARMDKNVGMLALPSEPRGLAHTYGVTTLDCQANTLLTAGA